MVGLRSLGQVDAFLLYNIDTEVAIGLVEVISKVFSREASDWLSHLFYERVVADKILDSKLTDSCRLAALTQAAHDVRQVV